MAELVGLIQHEIPEGRKQLQESHTNLERVADYCERNYLQATDKAFALDETKNFTTQSLASVAYQINVLATNMLQLLDLQANQLGDMESSINHLNQIVMIHKEKVARREIGVLTTNKNTTRQHKIIAPANPEKPMKYTRKQIDYAVLDEIGHGVKQTSMTMPAPTAVSTLPNRSAMKRTPSTGSAQSAGSAGRASGIGSQMTLPANASVSNVLKDPPSTKPPTPPTVQRNMGTLSRNSSSNYRAPQPIAPPAVPGDYGTVDGSRNYQTLGHQSPRRDSGASNGSLQQMSAAGMRPYATLQHDGSLHGQVGPPQPPQIPMESSPYRQTGAIGVTVGPQPPSQPAAHVQIGRAYPMQPSTATHNYLATLPRGISGITGGDPIAYGGYGGLPEGYPSLGGYTHGGIGYMTDPALEQEMSPLPGNNVDNYASDRVPSHHNYPPSYNGHDQTNYADPSQPPMGDYSHGRRMSASPPLPPPPEDMMAPQSALTNSQSGPRINMAQHIAGQDIYNSMGGGPVRPQNAPPPAPGSEYSQGLQQGGYVTDSEGNTLKYIEKVVAIYDYERDKEDELTFNENAVIFVIKKNDDGWWEGVLNGARGLFPGNYVEPLI